MHKIKKADSEDGWYSISPLDAQKLLDEQPANRPLRESKSVKFAEEMQNGKWRRNGEPIILDESGKLLDGQGRMRAVALCGKPQEFYVIHGIKRSYFPSIDTGQVRGGADTLALCGFKNYALASAVSRLAVICNSGTPYASRGGVSNSAILEFAKKNSERLNDSLEAVMPYLYSCLLPVSILAYVHFKASEIDKDKANKFVISFGTGEGLPAGSPILLLRNKMASLKGEAHKLTTAEKLALTIKTWNAYFEGKPMTLLKWSGGKAAKGKKVEPFPTFD